MQSVIGSLESILDKFAAEGGLDPSKYKSARLNQFNQQNDLFYSFPTTSGLNFNTFLYQHTDRGEIAPYIAVVIELGHIDSADKKDELLESIANENSRIYDPLKFSVDNGTLCLILRARADRISLEYIESLLPTAMGYAERYLIRAAHEFGLKPFVSKYESAADNLH